MTLRPLLLLVVCAAIAGCGGDDEPEAVAPGTVGQPPATATAPAPGAATAPPAATEAPPAEQAPAPETTTPPPAASGAPTGGQAPGCGRVRDLDLQIVSGDPPCDAARRAIRAFDLAGAKVQRAGDFVCEAGEAATRPVVLTCTGAGGEVVALEPGG